VSGVWKHDLSDNRVLIARGLCEENLLRSKEDLSIFMDITTTGRMAKENQCLHGILAHF